MSQVLLKLFSSYFKLFFKNFSKENISSQLLKGSISLNKCEFNEKVIQAYLGFNRLRVRAMHAAFVEIRAPLTKLKSKAPTLTIKQLRLELVEPTHLTQRARLAAVDEPVPEYKNNFVNATLDNMSVIVEQALIVVQLRGEACPRVEIRIENLEMQAGTKKE